MKTLSIALIGLALAVPASFALAQGAGNDRISVQQVVDIATEKGIVQVTKIELDDGKWEVEGCTADGRELELDLRSSTGDVLKEKLDHQPDNDCAALLR